MSEVTVFYSWQDDNDVDANRYFIRDALKAALKNLKPPIRPVAGEQNDNATLDEGLRGVSGTPVVISILLEKISNAAVFVADVTPVGLTPNGKKLPNPNVMVETGIASTELGDNRVIAVLNTHFAMSEELPFDMRNRRFPITYELSPTTPDGLKKNILSDLASELRSAICAVWNFDLERAKRALSKLDIHSYELAQVYRNKPSFFQPLSLDPNQKIVALYDEAVFRACALRYLDLGLIRADYSSGRYSYQWTFLGTEMLRFLEASLPQEENKR